MCVNIKRCLCYFTIPIVVEGVCVGYSGVCLLIIIIVCVSLSLSLFLPLFFCLFISSLSPSLFFSMSITISGYSKYFELIMVDITLQAYVSVCFDSNYGQYCTNTVYV